ncbi:MAG: protein translocase subunit SecD, partial [Pseudomonadota bacterium]
MLSGDLLIDAAPSFDSQNNEAIVSFRFNTLGAQKFAEITRENIGKRFAIVLDDKVITAPVIRSAIIGGSGQISGSFTAESANELSVLLRSGALPVPLKVIEERSIGPNLGADSIEAGKKASILGIVLVMGFMIINYGIFGIFANIGLVFNLIFLIGSLSLLQATLTLPGIAGMVLTLGMSVDANVIIYERIREELRNGKTPFAAIEHGLRVARSTIIDANVTTLIAAVLLFYFGTGTVKGFAVTLAIGILSSMFTATVITRLIIAIWLKRTRPKVVPI